METIPASVIRRTIVRLWYKYKIFVRGVTCGNIPPQDKDMAYWREKLFASFITYLLPVCLISLVPGVWIALKDGYLVVAIFDLLAVFGITLVIFNSMRSLNFRKIFVMGILYGLAMILLFYLGLFGPGLIYLLALSVFITLIFPRPLAYWSVGLNLFICIFFALVIQWKLFGSPLGIQYHLGPWIAVSSNLIFLSWISVLLISKTINSLERIITKDHHLTVKLRKETDEGILRNRQLKESEGYYKKLFFQGPSPMWILDSSNLAFLQVNEAAIQDYGFTNEEFLTMTIMDIKLPEDLKTVQEDLQKSLITGTPLSTTTRHRRQNQEQFPVEVKFSAIVFQGKGASLVIARDISEQVAQINAIAQQNDQLMKIAYIQSHHVRAPLARIMGLVNMIIANEDKESTPELLVYLDRSARDLDDIIRKITDHTQQLKAGRKSALR